MEVKQQISCGTCCIDSQEACYQKWKDSSSVLLSEICVHICAWPRCDLDSKQDSQEHQPTKQTNLSHAAVPFPSDCCLSEFKWHVKIPLVL